MKLQEIQIISQFIDNLLNIFGISSKYNLDGYKSTWSNVNGVDNCFVHKQSFNAIKKLIITITCYDTYIGIHCHKYGTHKITLSDPQCEDKLISFISRLI